MRVSCEQMLITNTQNQIDCILFIVSALCFAG